MKQYLILAIVLILCAALLIGCISKPVKPDEGSSDGKFDPGTQSSGTSGTGETSSWTKDITLQDPFIPSTSLSSVQPVTLSVKAEEAQAIRVQLMEEEMKVDGYTSYEGGVEADVSFAEIDPVTYEGLNVSIAGLEGEIKRFNEASKTRAAREQAEGRMRHKAYQATKAEEDYIYLTSWISMKIGRADTQVFSYVEDIYRYNREYEPDFYEVHGHTIDPVSGQALSLNDFLTDTSDLGSRIYDAMEPYSWWTDAYGSKEDLVPILQAAVDGCRDDGSFAWMVYPHGFEFYLVLSTKESGRIGHSKLSFQVPFEVWADILRPGIYEVTYDYLNWVSPKLFPDIWGMKLPIHESGEFYMSHYLVQKNGKRYLYALKDEYTTIYTVDNGSLTKVGEVLGTPYWMRGREYFSTPDPECFEVSCLVMMSQELYLRGYARVGEDGIPEMLGLFEYRGNSIPFANQIAFEAETFADSEATEFTVETVPEYTDFVIFRSDGKTFIDCGTYNSDKIYRLYVTGSEEEGWVINGIPKDELLAYEQYWEE
ncbi:MAG: hypothetical protein J5589_03160 [Firmicutes bacterium]|nr:hypothetical protein [Bacillota bacterium]